MNFNLAKIAAFALAMQSPIAFAFIPASQGIHGQISSRGLSCPKRVRPAGGDIKLKAESIPELYSDFFKNNSVKTVTSITDVSSFLDFIFEFSKFPKQLNQQMVDAGGRLHLIEGQGVAEDPTFPASQRYTFDERAWAGVPGSGGFPYADVPTRIVSNKLYDNHGSINLVLHEHGHSFDSAKDEYAVSTAAEWKKLMSDDAESAPFVMRICGDYCRDNPEEAFAELFAYYYACESTRADMEKKFANGAAFFKNLVLIEEKK